MPGLYEFEPRRSSRLALTVCLLAGIVASTLLVRPAVQTRDTPSIGLASVAVLATALVWAIRAGTSVTRLAVRQGQLEVLHQGGRLVFDLAGDHTVPEVHGRPGGRGWRVVLPRGDQEPFVVDASIVDADDFMRVLRFFKPHLAEH